MKNKNKEIIPIIIIMILCSLFTLIPGVLIILENEASVFIVGGVYILIFIGIIVAGIKRIKEILKGEEDDLSNY